MTHIYISYAREEGEISEKLEGVFKDHGFQIYRDSWNTVPSRSFHNETKLAIKKASHFILCLSETADQRPEQVEQLEIAYALVEDQKRQHQDPIRRLPIIPLVFPGGMLPLTVQSWKLNFIDQGLNQQDLVSVINRIHQSQDNPGQDIPPRLKKYLKNLHDLDVKQRYKAAENLGQIGDPAAIPALIYAFHDVNRTARCPDEVFVVPWAAIQALVQIGEVTIPSLLVALRDESRFASRALLDLGSPSIPGLLDALSNGDQPARFGSAWALGWIGDPSAVPGLLAALSDQDPGVQENTIRALGHIGHRDAVPGLLEVLLDPKNKSNIRWNAAIVLGEIKDPSVIPDLISILKIKSEDQWVKRFTATALGKIKDTRAIEILLILLKDGQKGLRQSAASALGFLGDSSVIPELIEAMSDRNKEVAWHAARSLGLIGDPVAIPGLLAVLKNRRHLVRKHAAKSLGSIGDSTAVPGLCEALQDRDKYVRVEAARSLGIIGDLSAVPELRRALWDFDWYVRKNVRDALAEIRTKKIKR
jgi:HEAT repeat protein